MDQIVGRKGSFTVNFICSLHKNYLQKKASYHKKMHSKYSNIVFLHVPGGPEVRGQYQKCNFLM